MEDGSDKDFNGLILEPMVYIGMPRLLFSCTNGQTQLWKAEELKEPDCRNHDITCHLADVGCCMTMLYDMYQI